MSVPELLNPALPAYFSRLSDCNNCSTELPNKQRVPFIVYFFVCFIVCFIVIGLLGTAAYAQAPVIMTQPVDMTVTLGQSVTFNVSVSGATRYQWNKDSWGIPNAGSAPSYTFTPTLVDGNHQYNVTIWGPGGQAVYSNQVWLYVAPRVDVPTVSTVEQFGVTKASDAADSFGLGVDSNQDWEFAAVAAMGGKWVRADGCQWESIEIQNPFNNSSGGFAPASVPNCQAEVASVKRYGLHLDTVAYWAPPHTQVAKAIVSVDVPAGSMSIPLTITSGTIEGYPARDLLIYGSSALRDRIDYGTPVDSVSGTTVTLPEPSLAAIPAGTPITLQALLYPPVLIDPSSSPTAYMGNASVQAWTRYIAALENYMHVEGVTGTVELWNEPEVTNELWDYAPLMYKNAPDHFDVDGSGRYLAFAAGTLPSVDGVKIINGWSDASGFLSMYSPKTLSAMAVTPDQFNKVFASDAFHLYGNNPEQVAWLPDVMKQDVLSGRENFLTETPMGGQVGANLKFAAFNNQQPNIAGGLAISMTEGGSARNVSPNETEVQRARFDVRQFLTFSGLHITPIIFFKAGQASEWDWFGEDDAHTPYPVVASFTGMLSDINAIGGASTASSSDVAMPQVASYAGYYPLATVGIVGSRTGDAVSSMLFYAWQKSYVVPRNNTDETDPNAMASWMTLPSPAAVPLQVNVPAGYQVKMVKDVVTQESVAYTLTGSLLTYSVADDPVEVLLIPAPVNAPAVTISNAAVTFGMSSTVLSATVAATSSTLPSGAFTFQVDNNGTVNAACATIDSRTQQCAAKYATGAFAAGYYTIKGSIAADRAYAATSATNTLTVMLAQPTLTVANTIASLNSGSVNLTANLTFPGAVTSTGAVTFRVGTAGPVLSATCSGSASASTCVVTYPLNSLLPGSNPITVALAADANYSGTTGTATLTLSAASALVTVTSVAVPYGTPTTTLNASVSYAGSVPPTGPVMFAVSPHAAVAASCLGTASPLQCSVSYPTATLIPNAYTVTASLTGDARFAPASGSNTLKILPVAPIVSVGSVSIPYGTDSTVLTAKVSYTGSLPPTGTVTMAIDSGAVLTATCAGAASPLTCTAKYATSTLAAGTHTVSGSIAASADGSYSSASGTGSLAVTVVKPVLTVASTTASLGSTTVGLTATLTFPGTKAPTGAVTFRVGNAGTVMTASCTGPASSFICAVQYPLDGLPPGDNLITAALAQDANFASASGTATLKLTAASASVAVTSATATYGTTATVLHASISFAGSTAPTGKLTIALDQNAAVAMTCVGKASPIPCVANVATGTYSPKTYTITATLAADTRFAAAAGVGTLEIVKTTPTVKAANASILHGAQYADLTATIVYDGSLQPTGMVTFTVDQGTAMTATCMGKSSPFLCGVRYPTSSLLTGTHTIYARLATDVNYAAAVGNGSLIVTSAPDLRRILIGNGNKTISEMTGLGDAARSTPVSAGGIAIAIDKQGVVWSLDEDASALTSFPNTSAGDVSRFTGAGINKPTALALDGADVVWVANGNSTVSAVSASGTAMTVAAYVVPSSKPTSVHADSAGNLWIASAGDDSITEVIGVATPVS